MKEPLKVGDRVRVETAWTATWSPNPPFAINWGESAIQAKGTVVHVECRRVLVKLDIEQRIIMAPWSDCVRLKPPRKRRELWLGVPEDPLLEGYRFRSEPPTKVQGAGQLYVSIVQVDNPLRWVPICELIHFREVFPKTERARPSPMCADPFRRRK